MDDLPQQLRRYGAYLEDVQTSNDPTDDDFIVGQPAPRPRRALTIVVALALLATTALLWDNIRHQHDIVTPSDSHPPVWTQVADPTGVFTPPPGGVVVQQDTDHPFAIPNKVTITAITATDDAVVAIGNESNINDVTVVAWRSTDNGTTWTRVPADPDVFGQPTRSTNPAHATNITVAAIATNGTTVIAVGNTYIQQNQATPTAFISDDQGITWTTVPLPTPAVVSTSTSVYASAIAHGPAGFVAVGYDPTERTSVTWTSTLGETWTRTVLTDSSAHLDHLIENNGTYIAGGTSGSHRAAIWTSDDAHTWQRTNLTTTATSDTPTVTSTTAHGRIITATVITHTADAGLTALNDGTFRPIGRTGLTIWQSTNNGNTWTNTPLPPTTPTTYIGDAITASTTNSDLILAQTLINGQLRYITLTSDTPGTWQQQPGTLNGTLRNVIHTDTRWIAAGAGDVTSHPPSQRITPTPDDNGVILTG